MDSPQPIFFLWGLAYIAVGWYYKVPISMQPLKAMAVIAITAGLVWLVEHDYAAGYPTTSIYSG